ncbi:MAG: outer membrane protein assembly factor BamA [Elusimicrobiota bacterium]
MRSRKVLLWVAGLMVLGASKVKAVDSAAKTPAPDQIFAEFSSSGTSATPGQTPSASPQTFPAPALGGLPLPPTFSTSSYQASGSSTSFTPALEEKHISRFAKILKIKTEGNRNVRERVILAQAKTRKGDLYDPEKLRKDVQSIFGLGNFDDVNVDVSDMTGGLAVTFQVVEKPMIKRIDFKGNKKLSSSKLRDAITLKENDPLDKLKLTMDIDKILTLYKDEGFAAAQAEPFTTSDATNHVTVTFFVTEGTRVLVNEVILDRVTAFKPKKIARLMKTRRKKVFKQEVLTEDLKEVVKFYKNNGYQNIKIGEIKQVFNEDKTRLTLTLPIDEGPLFHFGAVRFSGNLIFQNDKLQPAVQFKPGEIFNQDKMDSAIAKLQDVYGAQGYIRVQVKPEFAQDAAKGIVDTEFQMTEGEVVYVDHIGVEGNVHTKDFVIRREVQLKEGEPFSSVKARKSVERLYNLGFLDNVDVDVQQPSSPNKADVIFTVTEGKPGMLSAGAGYSSVDHLIGTFQIQHINFLGRGQRLNLMWQYGGRLNSFDLGWTEPWMLGKPVTFGVDIFNTKRIQQLGTLSNAYTTHDIGSSLTVGPRFSDIYSLHFTYTFANRLRSDVANDIVTRQAVLGTGCAADPNCNEFHAINSNLTQQFVRDTRDNQFDPQRGMRNSFAVTEGGIFPANAIRFYKPYIDQSIHIPTFWKFVLSLHGQFSWVRPYGDSTRSDIVDELYRVGGSETVRGYDLGHVGVLEGGEIMNVYNVEYKFPIAPDEHGRTLLQGVFFYDVGGSWNRFKDIDYRIGTSHAGLKSGVGFGIRFKTPVFPLRLDWGHALNPDPGEAQSQFYFTVGSLF